MNSLYSKVATLLQTILNDKATELAKSCGFIVRQRKLTGAGFIKTLFFGWLQNPESSLEGLVRAGFSHDVIISAQGLDKRFTRTAAAFVKSVLEEVLGQVIKASAAVEVEILQRFSHVYVADSSVITLPDELHERWQGTGGAGGSSRSAIKLDTCIELKTGQLQCGLQHGKQSDNRSPLANAVYERGSLRLQDLGYFNLERMKAQAERGEYWISRYQINTALFDEQGQAIDLSRTLHGLKLAGVRQQECRVELGVKIRLKARLLLIALPEEAAARGRAKMKENASKHGKTATQASLALCDWKILITCAGPELLSLKDCVLLYSVRWQIELLFKLWKSHSKLGHSNSTNPWRRLCELYMKLLIVMVQHWIFLTGLWNIPERSLVKGGQMIKEQAARLAACINDINALTQLLREFTERFQLGCRQNTRKKRPNTWRQLAEGCYEFA
jgi:hypothetical protein